MRPAPFTASYPTASEALSDLLRVLLAQPERPSRNGSMRELEHVSITIENPSNRYIVAPGRKASVAAQAAETMWVLAGRNDVPWLSRYLKRAADFSDDGGSTWAGAYGPRIRRWAYDGSVHGGPPLGGSNTFDQLDHVVKLLRADPTTRRAVITLYDPSSDSVAHESGIKDVPCNNWLSFHPTEGTLDLNVGIRSNDVIWGWSGINTFEWSVLLDLVAALTGFKTGRITYNTTSLHLYSAHYAKAERIIALGERATGRNVVGRNRGELVKGLGTHTTIAEVDGLLTRWFAIEEAIHSSAIRPEELTRTIDAFPAGEFQDWLWAIRYARSNSPSFLHAIEHNKGLQTAAIVSAKLPHIPATETETVEITPNTAKFEEAVREISKATALPKYASPYSGKVFAAPVGSDEWVELGKFADGGIEVSWTRDEGAQISADVSEPEADPWDAEILRNQLRRSAARTEDERRLIDEYTEKIREVQAENRRAREDREAEIEARRLRAERRNPYAPFGNDVEDEDPRNAGADANLSVFDETWGPEDEAKPFWEFAADLHDEKHAAYGPSWKKRGEMLGIMANVARKVDRLGENGAGETSADTALDLVVYLLKYRLWLSEFAMAPLPRGIWVVTVPDARDGLTDDPRYVRELLQHYAGCAGRLLPGEAAELRRTEEIRRRFDELEPLVEEKRDTRWGEVEHLIALTYPLAERLYSRETGWTPSAAERNATRSWNPEAGE